MRIILRAFTLQTARAKVRKAEDDWNTRDPKLMAMDYSEDCSWRNVLNSQWAE
ncbi:hypothetical protein GCM10010917_08380 [Paenibacillus physcomitrellae]|uniref:Transposase n=1 Tax=Paenibacillus physcomitrellae TaxID=1619311 RepID=A0ABQ1FQB0_9BACL|nr:hypothetical protein GCM10010917_08380 [Paenibacillus physcomitrellae]